MLTLESILAVTKRGWAEPHYFGQSSMPPPCRRKEPPKPFPPRTVILLRAEESLNWVITPYVGEEMTLEEIWEASK
jgi:hypothetical protein